MADNAFFSAALPAGQPTRLLPSGSDGEAFSLAMEAVVCQSSRTTTVRTAIANERRA